MPLTADLGYAPLHIDMKIHRAQAHLDALDAELDKWLADPKHYAIIEKTDFDKCLHIFRIEVGFTPEIIPQLLGDYVCNLRSALDQLAWRLATSGRRTFTRGEQRRIQFPITEPGDEANYRKRRDLFPPAVADVFDTLQPYLRGNAYRDDPLWKLNELWNLDKHRAIPMNANSVNIHFPMNGWDTYVRQLHNAVEVHFPLTLFLESEVHLKPTVSVDVLFGEYMGQFTISRDDLREINQFVREKVLPKFVCFFT